MIKALIKIILLSITCLCFYACPSDDYVSIGEPVEEESGIPNEIEIDSFLWQSPIGDDIANQSNEFYTKHPVFHDGKVIWNIPTSAGFVALDKSDGSTIWDNRGTTNTHGNPEIPKVKGDYLYYIKTSGLRKMNLNTGEVEVGYLWPNLDEYLGRDIFIDKDYLYTPLSHFVNVIPEFAEIIRSPLDDLSEDSWEHFGRITPEDIDGCTPGYREVTVHSKENGDELLIAVNTIACGLTVGSGSVNAINLRTNELEWQILDQASFQLTDLIYEDGFVFVHSDDFLYSIRAESGEIAWKVDLTDSGEDLVISSNYNLNVVSYQDLLVVVGHNDKIMAFQKSNGKVSWDREFEKLTNSEDRQSLGSLYGTINIHDGKLYYRNFGGDIMVLKLKSGDLRRFYLPEFSEYEGVTLYQSGFGRHDIIVDKDGTIYAADGYRFLAFKLPDW